MLSTTRDVCRALATRVRAQRLYRGWSQQELAERSGVAFSTLRAFERTGNISLERLVNVANALGALDGFDGLFRLPAARSLEELDQPERRRGRRRSK